MSVDAAAANSGTSAQQPNPLNFDPANPQAVQATTGEAILATARRMVWSDQATPYRNAIDEARKIQREDPIYADAQKDIAVWSQTIFDISQKRAEQKSLDIAIMAADLVPLEDQRLRPQADAQQQAKAICERQPI